MSTHINRIGSGRKSGSTWKNVGYSSGRSSAGVKGARQSQSFHKGRPSAGGTAQQNKGPSTTVTLPKTLSWNLQKGLARVLMTIKKGEQTVDVQRQRLATLADFEPHSAFQALDSDRDHVLTVPEIAQFLDRNRFYNIAESDIYCLINFYDNFGESSLRYDDFLQIVLPCDAAELRELVMRRQNYRAQGYIAPVVEEELATLLYKELVFTRQLEKLKQSLESQKQFDYNLAFNEIDDWGYGYIDAKNLKNFLRKHKQVTSQGDIMAIIRRMDLDGDARVSRDEFISALMPEKPYSKAELRLQEKQQSKQKDANFALGLQHGSRSAFQDQTNKPVGIFTPNGSTLDGMGAHLIPQRRKNKIMVPNCAVIIPQRYKKDYEENMEKNSIKIQKIKSLVQGKDWIPGGKTVAKTQAQKDMELKMQARSSSQGGFRYLGNASRTQKDEAGGRQRMRDLSATIANNQQKSSALIQRAQQFFDRYTENQTLTFQEPWKDPRLEAEKASRVAARQQKSISQHLNNVQRDPKKEQRRSGHQSVGANRRSQHDTLLQSSMPGGRGSILRLRSGSPHSARASSSPGGSSLRMKASRSGGPDFQNRDQYQSMESLHSIKPYERQQHSPLRSHSGSRQKYKQNVSQIKNSFIQNRRAGQMQSLMSEPRENSPLRQKSDRGGSHGRSDSKGVRFADGQRGRTQQQQSPQRSASGILRNSSLRNKSGGAVSYSQKFNQDLPLNQPNINEQSPLRGGSSGRRRSGSRSHRTPGGDSPLRQRSGGSRPLAPSFYVQDYENQSNNNEQSQKRRSNKELRNQYHRQINLCKQGVLNHFEASTLVGNLLDLINISRRQERLKVKLVQTYDEFNLMDAYSLIEPHQTRTPGQVSQLDFREAMLSLGVKADKVTMDRIYLFFKRYNIANDNLLRYSEFQNALCPCDPRASHLLRARQSRSSYPFDGHCLDQYVRLLEIMIDTEVQFESIRQRLQERKDFDVGKAFLTMATDQREQRGDREPAPVVRYVTLKDLERLMIRHDHYHDLDQNDLALLISRFDKDYDGRIGINEFYEQMEPQSKRHY